jgi:hypothetical protein
LLVPYFIPCAWLGGGPSVLLTPGGGTDGWLETPGGGTLGVEETPGGAVDGTDETPGTTAAPDGTAATGAPTLVVQHVVTGS